MKHPCTLSLNPAAALEETSDKVGDSLLQGTDTPSFPPHWISRDGWSLLGVHGGVLCRDC